MKRIAVVALGGNAIKDLQTGDGMLERSARGIVSLIDSGCRVVVTHGNGPQVGNFLLRSEIAKRIVPRMPLFLCDASTQATIGYRIQESISSVRKNIETATVVTRVVVDRNDRAFRNPTKPIGPFYHTKNTCSEHGWDYISVPRKGYRRVVASPEPERIVEIDSIKALVEKGIVVIACGGGGIPVISKNNKLCGVDAVIDKDLASALLAKELNAEVLIIVTDVPYVYLNYNRKNQKVIREMNLDEAEKYLKMGEFSIGSMAPKIEASVRFLKSGGRYVLITSAEKLGQGIKGEAGTRILA